MRPSRVILPSVAILVAACSANPDKRTLAELEGMSVEIEEVRVEDGLDEAMDAYRDFLEQTPESTLTPEAMRRLADLQVEKEFGLLGDGGLIDIPAPETGESGPETAADPAGKVSPAEVAANLETGRAGSRPSGPLSESGDSPRPRPARAASGIIERPAAQMIAETGGASGESDEAFERRTTGQSGEAPAWRDAEAQLPGDDGTSDAAGPREAIALYDEILETYPNYENNDQVLYQKSRAYDELGETEEAMAVMDRLVSEYPHSHYLDEVQFRRAEYFFTRKKYLDAEQAYASIIGLGEASEYYELALYKLGWTLYKQDMHEEALDQYVALLDYKVSIGYDFDQSNPEAEERRVADTYRVISLSFSYLGGSDAVEAYFSAKGNRDYEHRIYSHLAEFYFDKLRYHDAAMVYKAFIELNPLHRTSPHFSMRVVEIYEAGGFPMLVLESKKEFATTYGLDSEYWRHFDAESSPEVLSYLKSNLEDLANHYHALYQEDELAEEQPANFDEALYWYNAYLGSFPEDPETPGINYQLADLLMENEDFGSAALAYERTAYDYAEHAQAGAAGYAAIFAHRENEKIATGADRARIRQDAVESTVRFVDAFPAHEHAAVVLRAAVEDMYDMQEFERAVVYGHRLIDEYPASDADIQRAAWTVIAHASFDLADYQPAESAYLQVLAMMPADDEARPDLVDNLAASIYKQGEQANVMEDYRTAAGHFLRIRDMAPGSAIRPAAEYDAAAALMRLEDWAAAGRVLEDYRQAFPDHELNEDATKQLALVYREDGQLSRSAAEYERVAEEAEDPDLARDALLVAGDLYEEDLARDRALEVYLRYVDRFPEPVDVAVETRHKIAGMHKERHEQDLYLEQLARIVEIDAAAGDARTPRIRFLAGQSALVLAEELYARFEVIELVQPFEQSLVQKQERMDAALQALEALPEYEVGEVTAAATFYIAEIYQHFSQALLNSERPADLTAAELQDYELMLEEEAWPFEEQAIEVHEKNLELLTAGLFNPWIERSLDQLATLMPGRYAKFEISSGFIASIDRYSYRVPGAPAFETEPGEPSPDAAPAETVPPQEPEPSAELKDEVRDLPVSAAG